MKRLAILLVGICLVGCSSQNSDSIKESVAQMDNLKVTQEYKETVRSIGDKLFVDNELELVEKVNISESVKVDIAYYIQEQKSLLINDENVADHDEDLDTGDSQAIPEMEIDYDSLGIPASSLEEIQENLEMAKELMRVKIIEESYYSDTTILKYGNDDGSIFKILEVEGNAKGGIRKIEVSGR